MFHLRLLLPQSEKRYFTSTHQLYLEYKRLIGHPALLNPYNSRFSKELSVLEATYQKRIQRFITLSQRIPTLRSDAPAEQLLNTQRVHQGDCASVGFLDPLIFSL